MLQVDLTALVDAMRKQAMEILVQQALVDVDDKFGQDDASRAALKNATDKKAAAAVLVEKPDSVRSANSSCCTTPFCP